MRSLLAFIATLVVIGAARADIEFVGLLATPRSTSFVLVDTADHASEWRELNQAFKGYTLKSYEPATDTLVLAKDGVELRLPLKPDAKIKAARLELAGEIGLGNGEKIEVVRGTLRYDEENVFPLKDGLKYAITPRRRPDGTILFQIAVERVLAPDVVKRIGAPGVITLPGQPFSLSVGELQFSFTPRSS